MKTTWTQIKKIIDELMESPHSYSFDFLHDELLMPLQQKSEDFEKELRDYIAFIDNARSHAPSKEMKIKYEIYKEFLKE